MESKKITERDDSQVDASINPISGSDSILDDQPIVNSSHPSVTEVTTASTSVPDTHADDDEDDVNQSVITSGKIDVHDSDTELELRRCQSVEGDDDKSETDGNDRLATVKFARPFGASSFATFFNSKTHDKAKSQTMVCSPSPTVTVDSTERRKTIMNTFCITARTEYDKVSCQLYQDTISNRGKELHDSAMSAFKDGKFEACLGFLRKAMFIQPNNAELYKLRGEAYLQLCDFKSAILNYKHVCILQPDNEESFTKLAFIYFLLGQSYYDEQMYLDALECFTRAAEMKPKNSGYHARSIACLASLKRHKECLQLINQRLESESKNPDLFIMRARLHLLFCNPTLSYYDVKQALTLDPENAEADFLQANLENSAEYFKDRAVSLDMAGKTKEAIVKISQAIDSNPPVTDYYILRAGMHRRNLDFNAAVDDILLAMGKMDYDQASELYTQAQKQLLLTFNDFAVDCFRKGYYEEAIILLEKSIQGEKNDPVLYINRGDCFYKMDHLHFAMLDYQQAQELDGSNKHIDLRLSVVYNELGIQEYHERKYYRAEDYFSLAISHNCQNPMLYLSRAKSRYMQEKIEEAQVDIISALHLDKNNKEMLTLFSRLFPGKEVAEVVTSEYGTLVCEALDSVVADQNLTNHGNEIPKSSQPLPGISARFVVDQKLQQCMEANEFNISIIKGKKKVNELVESVIQSRQDLTYKGPTLVTNRRLCNTTATTKEN